MAWIPPNLSDLMNDRDWLEATDLRSWGNQDIVMYLTKDPMANDPNRHMQYFSSECQRVNIAGVNPSISLGNLDRLPPEIFDCILGFLDVASLESFGKVSLHARSVTESQSEYRLIRRVAPFIFPMLHSTGLSYLHSISSIFRELRFPNCRSCGKRGTFLFITTCERLCEDCAEYNQSYWSLRLAEAKQAFALEDRDLDPLPVVINSKHIWKVNITKHLGVGDTEAVAVKSVLLAATQKHGSQQALKMLAELMTPDWINNASLQHWGPSLFRYGRRGRFQPLTGDPSVVLTRPTGVPCNPRPGILTTLFPVVPRGWSQPMPIYHCNGCWMASQTRIDIEKTPWQPMEMKDPDRQRILRGRALTVRTIDELRHHISTECLVAKLLMFQRYKMQQDGKQNL